MTCIQREHISASIRKPVSSEQVIVPDLHLPMLWLARVHSELRLEEEEEEHEQALDTKPPLSI